MKRLLLHQYAKMMMPGMNIEELTKLILNSEGYRIKVAKGEIRAKTISIEEESEGKVDGRRKKKTARRTDVES